MTPEYASPEQLRGEALSTASDVYSLGILLYKLLTGEHPGTSESLARGEPDPDVALPSVVAGRRQAKVSRELRGDLDDIVLKALRPQPEARFGSVEQFSEDLERHLTGFPVLARQGSLQYRAKKFLRRHRLPVAAATLGLLVLTSVALSMTALAGRLADERAKLQEVVSFFRLFFERAGPLVDQGRNLTLREAVDQNAAMIADGLQDRPEVKVEIAIVLGDIYRELGQAEQALAWSDRALKLNQQLSGEDSQAYARSLVQAGAALRELGRFEASESRIRGGLAWLRSQSDPEPAQLVASLNNLVSLYCFQGRYTEVDDESTEALRLAEGELDDDDPATVAATVNRGLVLRQLGDNAAAQRLYERALDLYRRNLGTIHPQVATVLLNLGLIHRDRGQLALAQSSLEEANDQVLKLFGEDHYARIRPLLGLAKLAAEQQNVDGALTHYREAVRVAIAAQAPPPFLLRPALDLAQLMQAEGRCREVESLLRDSLEHCRPYADQFPRYAEIEGVLAECLP